MRLAITDLFRAKWTDEIHDEWIRNVLKNRPDLTEERLHRTKALMNTCFNIDASIHGNLEYLFALYPTLFNLGFEGVG